MTFRFLAAVMGASVVLEKTGRFYLRVPGQGTMEMPLVAEGLRKLAMVARLIATGSLLGNGYLFWDEPETNLNPRLVRLVAETIFRLCKNGIQVFVATHSLFLLREFEILSSQKDFQRIDQRYFAMGMTDDGVAIQQGRSVEDVGPLAVLDEELLQSGRFLQEA